MYLTMQLDHSGSEGSGTSALEIGMSGMTLVSGFSDSQPKNLPELLASTGEGGVELPQENPRGSASSSPVASASKGLSKPPGMGAPLPSPITKPTHRKNSSSNSPSLTKFDMQERDLKRLNVVRPAENINPK